MLVIEGVLKEEVLRLESNIFAYERMLNELPRGTIFIRKIHNASFVYRKKKENGKVVSEYLGPFNSEKVKNEINKSEEYKRIKRNADSAKRELKMLQKAVKAYEPKRRQNSTNPQNVK